MNNLMLYVEENLLYLPETCYENETTVPDNHNKESTSESINAPLILPQSTLEDTHFKTAPETEKSQNLSNVNDKSNSSFVNTSAKSYTNLFLEDIPEYNEKELNPKKLMQLWTENLQLQIQITTTLNMFFNKVLIDAEKSNENSLTKDENMSMNLFFETNDISSTNLTRANMSHAGQDATLSGANICNESLNINNYLKTFQNPDIYQETPKKVRVPPGYEKYRNNVKFDENYSARNVNSGLPTSNDFLNSDTPLKETNPFRLSLAGKLKIPEENDSSNPFLSPGLQDPQHLTSEYDLILQRFVEKNSFNAKTSTQEISENVCKDTLFNQSQHCLNNILSNTNNIKNESIASNWNEDNIANGMSKIAINNQHAQPAVQKSKEIEKNTEQYSFLKTDTKEKKDLNLKSQLSLTEDQRNEKLTLNYDLDKSAKLPNNNLASSTLINNMNLDEGYLTRPSTSDNTSTSFPLLHLNNDKSEYFQQLSESEYKFSDTWIKSFQNTAQLNDRNKMNFLFKNNEQTTGGNSGSLVNNESAGSQSSCSKENLLKNIKCMPLEHVVFFQVFELPTGLVHILHYQGEGWLLTDEFIQTFTKFESSTYAVIFFYICNIHLSHKQIDRTVYPLKFINVGRILSKTTQQIIHDKHYIHLVQLKSVVGILDMLEIISKHITNSVLVNNSVIQDIWFSLQMVNNAYRNLKYYIESAE